VPGTANPSPRHAKPRLPWRSRKVTFAVLGLTSAAAIGLGAAEMTGALHSSQSAGYPLPAGLQHPSASRPAPSVTKTYTQTEAPQAVSLPVSLSIPAIGVKTSLQQLGLSSSGALNPPTDTTQAGWYTGSAVPGQPGPAVLAGHVDSYQGPAVFFYLRDLQPGDTVTVTLSNGSPVEFSVTDVETYPKDQFPTAAVYGARPDSELRLITCGGSFDSSVRSYDDNVVVFATLVSS
jgi:sortase (surface protein transpeptidase)